MRSAFDFIVGRQGKFCHCHHEVAGIVNDLVQLACCHARFRKRCSAGFLFEEYSPARGIICREQQRRRQSDRDKDGQPAAKSHAHICWMRLEALSRNNRRKGENCNAAVGDASRIDIGATIKRARNACTSMRSGFTRFLTVRSSRKVSSWPARNPTRIGSGDRSASRDVAEGS